jgi:hypothetical protein
MVKPRSISALLLVVVLGLVAAGCAGPAEPRAEVPESASLAPKDALVYATLTTDESSAQWRQAADLIDRIPGARDGLADAVAQGLESEGVAWDEDVAPALGPEVVLVVTQDAKTIVLTKPESEERLAALLAKSHEPSVRGSVDGWVAIAEEQADLTSYEAAHSRGTLESDDRLSAGFAALPEEALGRVWVDLAGVTRQVGAHSKQFGPLYSTPNLDVGVDWLSAALAAEDDGIRVALGTRTPDNGGTQYEPKLFDRVPADAVAAFSFGGTQATVDKIEDKIPIGGIADKIESVTGVSLGGIIDVFSGEGVLYVRRGNPVPEVTLVLAPPDVDKAFENVSRIAENAAGQAGTTVRSVTEGGRQVQLVEAQGVTVRYARIEDAVIVTTGPRGIDDFLADGAKLRSSTAFEHAADEVGLEGRTGGFLYVDIDGVLPLVDDLGSDDPVPADARDVLRSLDSFILESSADGDVTTLTGVLRLND